jgi:hypothetical protein
MTIKSFRGLMADASTDVISLHTNTGSTGYRMIKFTVMPNQPFNRDQESIMKVYKIPQGTPDGVVDFSDNTLLAVGIFKGNDTIGSAQTTTKVFFDNEIFNQDLYITCYDAASGESLNYYFELELVKLDLNENTIATLKDIRNIEASSV